MDMLRNLPLRLLPALTGALLAVTLPAAATKAEQITPDSVAGQNIRTAEAFIRSMGGAELADNIETFLVKGYFYRESLSNGDAGKTTAFNNIELDPTTVTPFAGNLIRPDSTGDAFGKLVDLASTLIHEKRHAHQSYFDKRAWFGNYKEYDAWTFEILEADSWLRALQKKYRETGNAADLSRLKVMVDHKIGVLTDFTGAKGCFTYTAQCGAWIGLLETVQLVKDRLDKEKPGQQQDQRVGMLIQKADQQEAAIVPPPADQRHTIPANVAEVHHNARYYYNSPYNTPYNSPYYNSPLEAWYYNTPYYNSPYEAWYYNTPYYNSPFEAWLYNTPYYNSPFEAWLDNAPYYNSPLEYPGRVWQRGPYLAVKAGPLWVSDTDAVIHFSDGGDDKVRIHYNSGYDVGLEAGEQVGPWRFQGEFNARYNGINKVSVGEDTADASGHTLALTFLGDVIFDFPLFGPVTGHVGAGAGLAHLSTEIKVGSDTPILNATDNEFAYQAIGGISYPVTPNLRFDIDYRHLATLDTTYRDQFRNRYTLGYSSDALVLSLSYKFGTPAKPPAASPNAAPPPKPRPGAASPQTQQVASLMPVTAAPVAQVDPQPVAARPTAQPNTLAAARPLPKTVAPGTVRHFTLRFDDRLAALRPSGIRALDEALDAIAAGERVQISVEGCDGDAEDGSACARRLLSLQHLLARRGVEDPGQLLARG